METAQKARLFFELRGRPCFEDWVLSGRGSQASDVNSSTVNISHHQLPEVTGCQGCCLQFIWAALGAERSGRLAADKHTGCCEFASQTHKHVTDLVCRLAWLCHRMWAAILVLVFAEAFCLVSKQSFSCQAVEQWKEPHHLWRSPTGVVLCSSGSRDLRASNS